MAGKIYIYGLGGHGRVVADLAIGAGYNEITFLDDNGEIKYSKDLPKGDMIIAIGDCATRERLQRQAEADGFNLISLIHGSAVIASNARFGKGVVVLPNVTINSNAIIYDGAIINSSSVIEHDCIVGEFSHIASNATLCGGVNVGKRCWVGAGSVAVQNIKIKDDMTIGAGSVIVKDLLKGNTAYGNPCKVVK